MSETATKATMRLFIAVDLDPENISLIGQTINRLRGAAPRAKWVRAEKLHVTLVFLGDVEETNLPRVMDTQRSAVEKHHPFVLSFANGGTFGGKSGKNRARVLWAGIGGNVAALGALQNDLARRLEMVGYTPELRAYTPHLTLAHAGSPRGDEKLTCCANELEGQSFGEATIRDVVLYRSELSEKGATYTALLRVPLRT